jgi:pre-mRNA-splicing helicase BRR2
VAHANSSSWCFLLCITNIMMNIDDQAKRMQVPKTTTLALRSVVQPKKMLDLENMAFSQGGYLMSNKTTKLPQGSFEHTKKGYEEIHVPAPKSKPVATGELMPITELPEQVRQGFPRIKNLNDVQSKLYLIVFGTHEPILLIIHPASRGLQWWLVFVMGNLPLPVLTPA